MVGPLTQIQQPLTAKLGEKNLNKVYATCVRFLLDSFAPTASQFPKEPLQEGPCFDPNLHNDRGGRSAGACRPAERHSARERERGVDSEWEWSVRPSLLCCFCIKLRGAAKSGRQVHVLTLKDGREGKRVSERCNADSHGDFLRPHSRWTPRSLIARPCCCYGAVPMLLFTLGLLSFLSFGFLLVKSE